MPGRFVATVTDTRADADYVIISTVAKPQAMPEKQVKAKPKPMRKPTQRQQTVASAAPAGKQEAQQEITYNFYVLNNAVKNSDKSYFFSDREQSTKGVTLRIYCFTPWKDKDILKFQVINGQQQYFFISNVSLYAGDQLVNTELYNDPLVAPGNTLEGIILMPRENQKQLTLKLAESGTKSRNYSIDFNIP